MTERAALRKYIVGVDGSAGSIEALRQAWLMSGPMEADVDAVACWEFPRMYDGYVKLNVEDFKQAAQSVLDDSLVRAFGMEVPRNVTARIVEGNPKAALVDISADADMLVVGRHGRGGFIGMHLGSVSSACVSHAVCPVLVVHAPAPGE